MIHTGHNWQLHVGDVRDVLATLPERSMHTCVTSPPYFALRSYLPDDHPDKSRELGSEKLHDCAAWAKGEPPCGACYVCTMRLVFAGVWRVLRDDGTLWLNLGDSYAANRSHQVPSTKGGAKHSPAQGAVGRSEVPQGLKPKDLVGVPWRVALALQADGWVLRSDILWAKGSPMPESVRDRPTKSHEYVFLFAKQPRYFYDQDAERVAWADDRNGCSGATQSKYQQCSSGIRGDGGVTKPPKVDGRNLWTVWNDIPNEPFSAGHFAVFPSSLPARCVRLGTSAIGCCPTCGAPWRRVTERTAKHRERPNEYTKQTGEDGTGNSCANTVAGVESRTVGWEPTCEHPHDRADAMPCTVLEPFCGSGTTLRVAVQMGRRAVGIELNEQYAREIAVPRITRREKSDAPTPLPGQKALF